MAQDKKKKNKLPSGNVRIQVYDYTDVDGKKHYKSFTAPSKKEAKFMAMQWITGKANAASENLTVYDAVTRYIDAKRGVLSPSTIRGYEAVQRNYIKSYELGRIKLNDLSNTSLQVWLKVSEMPMALYPGPWKCSILTSGSKPHSLPRSALIYTRLPIRI